MPQYDDAMLDHLGSKAVFWPDQVGRTGGLPRAKTRQTPRTLLASLRRRHRAVYTVSPAAHTTPTPPIIITTAAAGDGPRRRVLGRSRSYTEGGGGRTFCSRTPSPSLVSSRSPSASPCFTPRSGSPPTPTPTTPVALPRRTEAQGAGRKSPPPLECRRWPSPGRIAGRAKVWTPAASAATLRGAPPVTPLAPTPILTEEDGGRWVLCTLERPTKNRRLHRKNKPCMEKNTAQYRQWLADTPKASKGGGAALLTRALSFKGRLGGKFPGMKSPMRPTGKIVKVEPSGSNESLESKVEHVWRALDFYKDVVDKDITDMLPGSATVVLEMVVALNLALKPSFSNQNSSAVASVLASVHQSLAELVRWSDQILLHNDDAHNAQTVYEVVQAVREAVQALVDLAADKENMYITDSETTPSSIDNNNSVEKAPGYYSNKHTEISSHRNSLPEIKAESPIDKNGSFLMACDNSAKLSHSRSSDSILTGSEVESPPPKPPLPFGRNDVAPPLPPKKKTPKGNSPESYVGNPIYLTSPVGHSSPMNYSPRESSSEWPNHSAGPASLSASLERGSRITHSSDQVSPASSLDSMNQPHDDHPTSRTSLNSCCSLHDRPDLDFESALHKNFRIDVDNTNLTDFGTNSGFPSIASVHSISSNTGCSSFSQSYSCKSSSESVSVKQSRTQTYFSSSTQVSSKVTCSTQRLVAYTTTRSSTSSSASSSSIASEGEKYENHTISVAVPPALPAKQRLYQGRGSSEVRAPSTYDNLDFDHIDGGDTRFKQKEDPSPKLPPKIGCTLQLRSSSRGSSSSVSSGYSSNASTIVNCSSSSSSSHEGDGIVQLRRQHNKFEKIESHFFSSDNDDNPPPLPVKKKHVHDYMKLFGQVSEPNPSELLRHSVHQMHLVSAMESRIHDFDHDHDFFHTSALIGIIDGMDQIAPQPPALPPKMRRMNYVAQTRQSLPASPQPLSISASNEPTQPNSLIIVENNCRRPAEEKDEPEEVIIQDQSLEIERKKEFEKKEEEVEEEEEEGPLDFLDVKEYLILKKDGEEGPDIRGGPVDALIVHASKANKNDFLYQEAFLTTYRTFISPDELVNNLLKRYNKFASSPDVERQKAARNAFSLLVRVVDDLAITDLNIVILETLTDFEYTLLCRGELLLARALRRKIVEKLEARKRYYAPKENFNIASLGVTTKQATLLDFKSHDIAEQMTLLDAELFLTMEIPEVLLWAREQNEEKSPNLTTFTEHFNKMSYWARSQILEQGDSKDREKYVMKFIKIMKHLRKINNFNSYLALLSALDSAPIRRLEWQRTITDGLKEYCALIDSSSSFRAYRQALSDSTPPCIPYIGLILQDLTFVNIGNNDLMHDGSVNFSKRWQQFNILDNMKRFKKCQYHFKKNEKVIAFFDNFEHYLNEEALWSISEGIKPRGGKKK